MIAEVSFTPKVFETLDTLFSWLMGQFRHVADEGGIVFFSEDEALNLIMAYDALKTKEAQV